MKMAIFVILLHFMPKNYKNNHPFWDNYYESKDHKKYKELKRDVWFPKSKWRDQDYSLINGFYSYLRSNFPNPIPYTLFFTGGVDYCNVREIADKWLGDILSGKSFYTKNKYYFSRDEVKNFLTCNWCEHDLKSSGFRDLIKYYFDAKIKANQLEFSSDFFTDQFGERFVSILVQDYFKFISRNKDNVRDQNEIGNIWDFLRERDTFDFNNMTWQQLRHQSDEWHQQLIAGRYGYSLEMLNKEWKKTIDIDFTYNDEEREWTITEITSGKLLFEEGKDMHNCVFSYLGRCISRNCTIFSVKENDKRVATLEISREHRLIQAKGKFNYIINKETQNIIIKWANKNSIRYKEYFNK
jgi:hypothetical protein